MKKSITLCLLATLSVIITACGEAQAPTQAPEDNDQAQEITEKNELLELNLDNALLELDMVE